MLTPDQPTNKATPSMNTSESPQDPSPCKPINEDVSSGPVNDAVPESNDKSKGKRRTRPRKPRGNSSEKEALPLTDQAKYRHERGHGRRQANKPAEPASEAISSLNTRAEGSRKTKSFKERMEKFSRVSNPSEVSEPCVDPGKVSRQKDRQPRTRSKATTSTRRKEQDYSTEDLRTKLTLSLADASYECMVCWETIGPKNTTWSCKHCWAVFHLPCIKRWSQSSEKSKPGRVPF